MEIDHEQNLFESCKFHVQEELDLMDSVQRYLHATDKDNRFYLVMEIFPMSNTL